jgi:hypothetical protein
VRWAEIGESIGDGAPERGAASRARKEYKRRHRAEVSPSDCLRTCKIGEPIGERPHGVVVQTARNRAMEAWKLAFAIQRNLQPVTPAE